MRAVFQAISPGLTTPQLTSLAQPGDDSSTLDYSAPLTGVEKRFLVILNEVMNLAILDMTRFFALLRMTMGRIRQFFNSLIIPGSARHQAFRAALALEA